MSVSSSSPSPQSSTAEEKSTQPALRRVPTIRLSSDSATVRQQLGLLEDLAGNWHGHGFNLIARPDREGNGPLFLELSQTDETLKLTQLRRRFPIEASRKTISSSLV